jgi:serine/threonine protein kinase
MFKIYEWNAKDAAEFRDFLVPKLSYDINKRATALEYLYHAWITGRYPDDYEYVSLKSVFSNTSFSRSAASTQAVLLPQSRIKINLN